MKWVTRRIGAIVLTAFGLLLVTSLVSAIRSNAVGYPGARMGGAARSLTNPLAAYFAGQHGAPAKRTDGGGHALGSGQLLMDALLGADGGTAPGAPPLLVAFHADHSAVPADDEFPGNGLVRDGSEPRDAREGLYHVGHDPNLEARTGDSEAAGNFPPEPATLWSVGRDGGGDNWLGHPEAW